VLGLSPIRLVIVAIIGLILLGPDKLPQAARQAGALWHSLRQLQQKVEDELHEAVPDLPRSADLVRYARSPVSLLNQLADRASADAKNGTHADGADGDEENAEGAAWEPPDDEPPEVKDPDRQPLAWGDPSLN
jgi:sec-independent protein translocase protein TatB